MKRLLWSMSLACFLPAVAGMSAQAENIGNVAFENNTQDLTSGFSTSPEVVNATSAGFTQNFSPATQSLDSVELPATKVAAKPKKAVAARPLPLKTSQVATNLDSVPVAPLLPKKTTKVAVRPSNAAAALPLSVETSQLAANLDFAPKKTSKVALTQNTPTVEPTTPATPTTPAVEPTTPATPTTPAVEQQPPASNTPKVADGCNCATNEDTSGLNNQLDGLRNQQFPVTIPGSGGFNLGPAISINNPVGFGADKGIGFLSASYQSRTRGTQVSDGELGIGVGLFDATEAIGLEVSYTINSFGTSQGFGSGGFNAKLHKRLGDASVAIGWNRFANITFGNTGVQSDYPKNSYYAVATQVIRNGDDIDGFFSRIALSGGVGGGQFLSQDTLNKTPAGQSPSGVNVFGSAAFRIAKPLSAIVEWTGQDLAAGLSITPFDGFPLVITPAFRDISGIQGESARFVLGVGTAWQF
jgi:hypothetical protein